MYQSFWRTVLYFFAPVKDLRGVLCVEQNFVFWFCLVFWLLFFLSTYFLHWRKYKVHWEKCNGSNYALGEKWQQRLLCAVFLISLCLKKKHRPLILQIQICTQYYKSMERTILDRSNNFYQALEFYVYYLCPCHSQTT